MNKISYEGCEYYIATLESDKYSSFEKKELIRSCGSEKSTLYSCSGQNYSGPDSGAGHDLSIVCISDGYLYFTESGWSQNDWYMWEEEWQMYRYKTDGSGEVELFCKVQKSGSAHDKDNLSIDYEYYLDKAIALEILQDK